MTVWRMAFKWGSQGESAWIQCQKQGIAAIGYYKDTEYGVEPIVGDCSQINVEEYNQIWRNKCQSSPASKASLRKFAYEMSIGDIIYVKDGKMIVGKGMINSDYKFEPEGIVNQEGILWEHYREVYWDTKFEPFELVLGADLHTVLELTEERLQNVIELDKLTNGN